MTEEKTEGKKAGYDISSILHEMREEYWQGLTEVEEGQEERLECVTFVLGGETYAFETVYASEVIRVPKLVRVPKVQEIIVGVFNLRGEITAALDIRPFLGLPQPPLTATGRIIVVKSDTFATGLLTEKVEGVSALSLNSFEPVVKSLAGAQREYIRGQLNVDGNLIMLLDIKKLMAAPEIVVEHK
ncbi:MAG: purine-binding chemotaxis protein [Geobacteraceae bacterium]|nr:MAG: purine-binding chemotaxis protein [Geobacteraceae bacterium]